MSYRQQFDSTIHAVLDRSDWEDERDLWPERLSEEGVAYGEEQDLAAEEAAAREFEAFQDDGSTSVRWRDLKEVIERECDCKIFRRVPDDAPRGEVSFDKTEFFGPKIFSDFLITALVLPSLQIDAGRKRDWSYF